MPKRNLGDLVKDASKDIQPETPMARGRGLAGMIGETAAPAPPTPEHPHVHMSTSTQADMSTSTHNEAAEPKRPVKSFRLREDLTHQIEVLAAQQRRKLYELVEEALEEYLARRSGGAG